MESFKKEILHVAREYDLDMSLLMHLRFLDRVHTEFYKELDEKGTADIKPIILKSFKSVFNKNLIALLELLYLGKTPTKD